MCRPANVIEDVVVVTVSVGASVFSTFKFSNSVLQKFR
jgi:hypothetical protein